MNTHSSRFKVWLGMFIIIGLSLFVLAIFVIGKQKNLFNPVFKLTTTFHDVGGLQVGNNIRFSGINVGTVDNIRIINDTTVKVDLLVRNEIQKFIKTDCEAAIGSEGIIGDKVLVITQGSSEAPTIKNNQQLISTEPVETDAIMTSIKTTADNAAIVSEELAEILYKVNSGKGTLGKLIQDTTIAANINQTIVNLKQSSKGLDENMEAAKHNFLLKGYFNKKAKAADKKKKEGLDKQAADEKLKGTKK